jgi:transposase
VECGHDVIVANPRNLRVIYENDRKSDRVDAHQLARVARVDPQLLHPIEHRPLSVQHDLTSLRTRQALVRARTQLVNHVRTTTKPFAVP